MSHDLGPMQNTFGICVERICLGLLTDSLMLNTVKRVLPWQLNFEKSTECKHTEKYKKLIYITVTLLMLKNSKNQCKKTSQFKTQCKGDISHVFETAKITVFIPRYAKLQMRPYKTSCCAEHLYNT